MANVDRDPAYRNAISGNGRLQDKERVLHGVSKETQGERKNYGNFNLLVIGGGSSALAPFVVGDAQGFFPELVGKRVAVVSKAHEQEFGRGGALRGDGPPNSDWTDFFAAFQSGGSFDKQVQTWYSKGDIPTLGKAGDFFVDVGARAAQLLDKKALPVLHDTSTTRINVIPGRRGNTFQVHVENSDGKGMFLAENVIAATGGEEKRIPGFTPSGEVFGTTNDELKRHSAARADRVYFLGNGSSAWGTSARIHELNPNCEVTIQGKEGNPARPYFSSVEEARAAGYQVTELDTVDPNTNQVNRAHGVRGIAQLELLNAQSGNGKVREVFSSEVPDKQGVVKISAIGYESVIPDVYCDREKIGPLMQNGIVLVDQKGQCLDLNGQPIKGLFALGFCAGRTQGDQSPFLQGVNITHQRAPKVLEQIYGKR